MKRKYMAIIIIVPSPCEIIYFNFKTILATRAIIFGIRGPG